MNNEQILLNIFKHKHINEAQQKTQLFIIRLSFIASIFGVLLMSIFFTHVIYIVIFAVSILLTLLARLLSKFNVLSLHVTSLGYMVYACFIFIPIFWFYTGVLGSAPYISIIFLVSVLSMYSRNILNWFLPLYHAVLLFLTILSSIFSIQSGALGTDIAYSAAAYLLTITLISSYTLSNHQQYDTLNDKFLLSSFRDELTNVYNRKLFDSIIEYEEQLYKKEKKNYLLVIFDIDKFKKLNDERGHVFGDVILRSFAECINKRIRETDFMLRFGGDEFLVFQSNSSHDSVNILFERIEEALSESCYMEVSVSASYGYAFRSECKSPLETLELADKRLYEKKEALKKTDE